ncbi:MAG: FAD-dependent oxidoreductase [Clostridia bacterium]|nr:FAD-dependent oxidoreductase [Clostridia bacterium]
MYDIIVIGAGPAGLTAALYARRAQKNVLIIEKSTFGGQITHSPRVENYPGFSVMSGTEFADKLVEQVLSQGAEIELDCVTKICGNRGDYTVICENGQHQSKSIIIATGSHHRQLGLDKENAFIGEGISYCAVCDGAFYKDKTVAVIGGGNTALQEAVMLSDICTKVYIVQNMDTLTGEKKLIEDISIKENVEVILSSSVIEILAENTFKGIKIESNGKASELLVDGIFVAIGQQPENEPFKDIISLNEYGYIISDEDCLPKTKFEGIFVAGDCRTKSIRQITTATADGAVSALAACKFVDSLQI